MRSDSKVLLVSGVRQDTIVFDWILGEYMVIKKVQDLPELQNVLRDETHYDVVLCGWTIRKGTWRRHCGRFFSAAPFCR